MHAILTGALLGSQLFVVLFLALHDWVPLGALNDVRAVQAADPRSKLIAVTLVSAAPFVFGFGASLALAARPYPRWLIAWLAVSHVLLLLGQVRAWWVPYLFAPEPKRAARYAVMFGRTHAFLPERNGIRPNTLHLILTAAILATLALVAAVTRS